MASRMDLLTGVHEHRRRLSSFPMLSSNFCLKEYASGEIFHCAGAQLPRRWYNFSEGVRGYGAWLCEADGPGWLRCDGLTGLSRSQMSTATGPSPHWSFRQLTVEINDGSPRICKVCGSRGCPSPIPGLNCLHVPRPQPPQPSQVINGIECRSHPLPASLPYGLPAGCCWFHWRVPWEYVDAQDWLGLHESGPLAWQ